ncbi:hypothetical protein [Salicibibacter cibarius]|uniref:hypothetical protein n=1 Tax=Salicibibacter cibarius TaxID=2743000 RepID=UPI001FE2F5FC|nr:hypothetical protein [Salicibibacter cibarius]
MFYRGNMFERTSETRPKSKYFITMIGYGLISHLRNKTYINVGFGIWRENNPTLVKVGKKYFLNFSYQSKVALNKTKIIDQKVCAVDLGINNSAVCSVMDVNGTVLAREFINQLKEKRPVIYVDEQTT